MSKAEIEAVWYARLPDKWADAPEWMSFSRLLELEACPRRWSLNSASYSEIWSHQGYPPKVHLAALAGQIIHSALEAIGKALSRAGCSSVTDEHFVSVMRELGGYSKIIEETINNLCDNSQDNPRFASKFNYISTRLQNSVPALREQLQVLTAKLRLQAGVEATTVRGSQNNRGAARSALGNATYPEVELRVEPLRWRGFVDVLSLSDTGCEIVDYKTGMPKPEHEDQVRVYSLLWARDEQLNPTGRTVDCLTLAYSTIDVAVEPPTTTQLDILEQEIVSRSKTALGLAHQTPPPAVPSIHNCGYCPVRQMCGDYWTPQVQQVLAEEVLHETPVTNEDFIDLEIENPKQQTPLSWSALVVLCRALPARSQILIRLSEPTPLLQNIFNSGVRIRVLDALLINQLEEDVSSVYLTKMSEAYIV
ncbi:MAG: PD-(D/E)XK nuclease family protein [Acidobacteriota bacterium]